MKRKWPFAQPEDLATFCRASIFEEGGAIVRVGHNSAGHWMFLDGYIEEGEEPEIVCLSHVFEHDPTIAEVADLPAGWIAERDGPGLPWRRSRLDPDEDQ